MKKISILVFTIIALCSCSYQEEYSVNYEKTTYHYKDDFNWDLQFYRTPITDSSKILIYFHGSGGDINTWETNESNSDILEYWQAQKTMPVIVSVSLGPTWLLVPQNSSPISGQLDFFNSTILPEIQKELAEPDSEYYIMGFSMGGYNAMQVALSNPGLFKKVILVSPAIFDISPYADQEQRDDYIKKMRRFSFPERIRIFLHRQSWTRSIDIIQNKRKEYIPDNEIWQKISLFRKMNSVFSSGFPEIYISGSRSDQYGIYGVSKEIREIARKNEIPIVWKGLRGDHLVQDGHSIAVFILR